MDDFKKGVLVMVIIVKQHTSPDELRQVIQPLEWLGLEVSVTQGIGHTVLGLLGDVSCVDVERFLSLPQVETVMEVPEPYKKANRKFHPQDTAVQVGGAHIGGGGFSVIAGPCSVESPGQVTEIAQQVQQAGASFLRGGAFKPRTSPYAFQGMGEQALEWLEEAKAVTGLPIVSELTNPKYCDCFEEKVDVIQIGARNMQNFDLLREVGKMSKPVLLKRGLSNTYEEWILSAEYILAQGNEQVILCERGIRTMESYTRNTLDISAVPAIRKMSHLPVVVDPSHACGKSWMVEPLALAAAAVGADGLMVEVHNDPAHAKCDGQQSLTPMQFREMMEKVNHVVEAIGKRGTVGRITRLESRKEGNGCLKKCL